MSATRPMWFWEWLDGISMQSQLNVPVRQKTFVAQLNTRTGFSSMPFSPERTKEIQSRIDARLRSGQTNDWEVSFLTNMAERFERHGTETRLSKAQYASLHKVLKLEGEKPAQTRAAADDGTSKPPPKRRSRAVQARPRPISVSRAITAPRRAVRKAQRQIMVPLVIAVGFFALVGSVFETSNSRSTPYSPSAIPTSQTTDTTYVYVTGTRVNQRSEPSTANAVMGVLSEGTRVEMLRDEGQWTQIRSNLGVGWMSSSFLSPVAPPAERPASQDRSLRASDVRIIDGDTIDIRGMTANVRLVGFNAPETWRPSCTAERQVGEQATARLGQLVRGAASIEFERVACSCRPGTEGTDRCNFGRFCGSLFVDGRDVGSTLIAEGLAVPYQCGRTSCPPPPQPWCR
ncbi:SH3 domain-containing protein [Sulfitobacter pseudonitzschiae]|nr:SH3 domain-containing protein [Pseudosulfitobacter pseudonitzschiae]MBM2299908.1 SH3 domain-containing protein [Pseudosulfitobacter pseudonitzschiae]MBM2304831.1 SH3 domain-containing protein [Pseudosulfitobacter pseudonitzschiae]MBM2314604.1 SH3 domain-containing protein [Pseudosulfitobacter pseudonitzschiae]MBM2319514.1 SH3 domain-containing protein [Pseudosulfitobacter pseudonitzschiae]